MRWLTAGGEQYRQTRRGGLGALSAGCL